MKNTDHQYMHQGAKPQLFEYAKKNRWDNTEAEKRLWEALKMKKLDGFKFRSQHPLGKYIVDFYCHSPKLAIEVDGGYHEQEEQQQYDLDKDSNIESSGVKVLRFTNAEVINEMQQVKETIRTFLNNNKP